MHRRFLRTLVVTLVVSLFFAVRSASAMESIKIEVNAYAFDLMIHQVCIGEDPHTGLIRVRTEARLMPNPYAQEWIVFFTAEARTEDLAHGLGEAAAIALLFGGNPGDIAAILSRTAGEGGFMLDINRLSVWAAAGGPSIQMVTQAVGSDLMLLSTELDQGPVGSFVSGAHNLGIGEVCVQSSPPPITGGD